MNIPAELKYMDSHEWLQQLDGAVRVGITDHAQEAMGELVFVDLPAVGDTVTANEQFADVESVKAVSGVFSPVTGVVTKINEALIDAPEKINEAPYDAWFIEVGEVTDTAKLLDAAEYEKLVAEEA